MNVYEKPFNIDFDIDIFSIFAIHTILQPLCITNSEIFINI